MANVAHSTLTGAELHEPKGIDAASSGEVYVADGLGSGGWANVGTSSFTGMIADFTWPVVQDGWLECDGSVISTTTYSTLYSVMSISTSGTRTNGSAIITSVPSTTNFRVGYYVFGAGIASGTTILSVDSASQITLSNNASSSGTSAFVVSPWLLNTGTIKLPDLSTYSRFRRSRGSDADGAISVGKLQSGQNLAHTHTGTTSTESADHTHTYSGSTGNMSANATHGHPGSSVIRSTNTAFSGDNSQAFNGSSNSGTIALSIASASTEHTHTYSGTTNGKSATHTHTYTTSSNGGTEVRPAAIVVMTCVKT